LPSTRMSIAGEILVARSMSSKRRGRLLPEPIRQLS